MSIIDKNSKNNFPYLVSLWTGKDAALEKALLDETGADHIRSKIFFSKEGETTYVFVFITEGKGKNQLSEFKLNVVAQTGKGKPSRVDLMVDYEILGINQKSLEVINGPDNRESFTVQATQPLFPF